MWDMWDCLKIGKPKFITMFLFELLLVGVNIFREPQHDRSPYQYRWGNDEQEYLCWALQKLDMGATQGSPPKNVSSLATPKEYRQIKSHFNSDKWQRDKSLFHFGKIFGGHKKGFWPIPILTLPKNMKNCHPLTITDVRWEGSCVAPSWLPKPKVGSTFLGTGFANLQYQLYWSWIPNLPFILIEHSHLILSTNCHEKTTTSLFQ